MFGILIQLLMLSSDVGLFYLYSNNIESLVILVVSLKGMFTTIYSYKYKKFNINSIKNLFT
jgi:hypothetical protein